MKKNIGLSKSIIWTLLALLTLQSAESMVAMAEPTPKSFSKRAKNLYTTLTDDWKCLLSRKRKCTLQQKARITGELLALAALLSGAYLSSIIWKQWKRQKAEVGQRTFDESMADAIRNKNVTRVREILKSDPSAINTPLGWPYIGILPLHAAAKLRNIHILKVLLENDADPNKENNEGATPLHSASASGSAPAAELLLKQKGVDPNKVDNKGSTPLNDAILFDSMAVAKLLLRNGANPNKGDNEGITPLHRVRNKAMAELLLENGADPTKENKRGITPLEWAQFREKSASEVSWGGFSPSKSEISEVIAILEEAIRKRK